MKGVHLGQGVRPSRGRGFFLWARGWWGRPPWFFRPFEGRCWASGGGRGREGAFLCHFFHGLHVCLVWAFCPLGVRGLGGWARGGREGVPGLIFSLGIAVRLAPSTLRSRGRGELVRTGLVLVSGPGVTCPGGLGGRGCAREKSRESRLCCLIAMWSLLPPRTFWARGCRGSGRGQVGW